MADKKINKQTTGEKLSSFLLRNRIPVIVIASLAIAVVLAYAVTVTVIAKVQEKDLAEIDTITYELTKNSSDLSDTDLEARRTAASTSLDAYTKKGGITGVRANMLAAEIAFERKNYAEAQKCWEVAAAKGKKSYTAPLAYFNEAVCSEEMNKLDDAVTLYQKAADTEGFEMASHAQFCVGRVKEAQNDYKAANDAYQKLIDKTPDDTWAHLAKSRQITLKTEGKIQ